MTVAKPVTWHYKLAYYLFAFALIVMAGRTIGGALSFVWHAVIPDDPPITTVYTPETNKPSSDYYWPN